MFNVYPKHISTPLGLCRDLVFTILMGKSKSKAVNSRCYIPTEETQIGQNGCLQFALAGSPHFTHCSSSHLTVMEDSSLSRTSWNTCKETQPTLGCSAGSILIDLSMLSNSAKQLVHIPG